MNTKTFLTYYLPNIMFNVAEIGAIVVVGILFKVPIPYIISIFVCFILNRLIFRKSMHYKDWYLCFIWSTLLFISFFLLSKIDIHLASISTCLFIFFTNKVDIKDLNKLFFWGGNVLNQEVFDWVKFNQNNEKLIEYENNLKKTDKRKYFIFVYRFREFKSYSEISKIMDIDIQRISDEVKIISHFIEYSIRLEGE